MYRRKGNEILKALQLTGNQSPVSFETLAPGLKVMNQSLFLTPRTGIGDIEMVTALLWRELRTGLTRDEAAEGRLLTLELARFVIGIHPIGDFSRVSSLIIVLECQESLGNRTTREV